MRSACPVDELLAASGGVPRRVHELASAWARREAARRVDAVADRTAAGRERARELETELAGSIAALRSTNERAELLAAPGHERAIACPFKGLATFDVDDADVFFGRERLVAELVARLVGAPLLAIVGPSGSGKSSVLRAGLLPALAAGVLPGSDGWAQALIRPGERPAHELGRATAGLPDDRSPMLAVDQFEESFTACRDGRERTAFIDSLVEAARIRGAAPSSCSRCAPTSTRAAPSTPSSPGSSGANHVLVGPMSGDELRRAITRPAERVGLSVEPNSRTRSWRTSRDSRARCRCCPRRCSSCGASAAGASCGWRRTAGRAASTARWRGWPRTRTRGWSRRTARSPARFSCGSPTSATTARSCAAGCRSTSSSRSAANA